MEVHGEAAGFTGFLVRAACLTDKGSLKQLDPKSLAKELRKSSTTTWVHIRAHDLHEARKFLQFELGFHPLAVEDALSEHERPALQEMEDHLFLSATAVEESGTSEEYVEVGFFLLEHALVTVVTKDAPALEEWFNRWCEHAKAFGSHPAFIMHAILDAMVDNYFPVTDKLEDEVEDLADNIYLGGRGQLQDAMNLKRRLLELRRRVTPIRDVVNGMLRRDVKIVPADIKPYLQDVYDHTLRIADIVDINRDTLATALDAHLAIVSNNLNVVMRKMTVYATMLMTMSLVAGIYGMNFAHMPELKWQAGYPFALGLMAVVGVVQWFLFKRRGWL